MAPAILGVHLPCPLRPDALPAVWTVGHPGVKADAAPKPPHDAELTPLTLTLPSRSWASPASPRISSLSCALCRQVGGAVGNGETSDRDLISVLETGKDNCVGNIFGHWFGHGLLLVFTCTDNRSIRPSHSC